MSEATAPGLSPESGTHGVVGRRFRVPGALVVPAGIIWRLLVVALASYILVWAVSPHPLAIVTIIAAGALTFGVIGALIAILIASSIYVMVKYLAGRDPDHIFPPREAAPESPAAVEGAT